MKREELEKIADLIAALPHGRLPDVHLGASAPAAVEALVALGAIRKRHEYDDGMAIVAATISIRGVEFKAQYSEKSAVRSANSSNGVPVAVGDPEAETVSAAIVPGT